MLIPLDDTQGINPEETKTESASDSNGGLKVWWEILELYSLHSLDQCFCGSNKELSLAPAVA
jgi:hypothetical protein